MLKLVMYNACILLSALSSLDLLYEVVMNQIRKNAVNFLKTQIP